MSSNSVTTVTYDREDIDGILRINNVKNFESLGTVFLPTRPRGIIDSRWIIGVRPRQIIHHLIRYFQNNPIQSRGVDPYWYNSSIPFFLTDLRLRFSRDQDVIKLFQIPHIKNIPSF
jgi:hypothetical protein